MKVAFVVFGSAVGVIEGFFSKLIDYVSVFDELFISIVRRGWRWGRRGSSLG